MWLTIQVVSPIGSSYFFLYCEVKSRWNKPLSIRIRASLFQGVKNFSLPKGKVLGRAANFGISKETYSEKYRNIGVLNRQSRKYNHISHSTPFRSHFDIFPFWGVKFEFAEKIEQSMGIEISGRWVWNLDEVFDLILIWAPKSKFGSLI